MLFISGKNITFKYEDQIDPIFSGLNFRIDTHSKIGVVGENGTGKTTLLKLLMGQMVPQGGSLLSDEKTRVGYFSQLLQVQPQLSIEDFMWSANYRLLQLRKRMLASIERSEKEDWESFSDFDEQGGYIYQWRLEKLLSEFELSHLVLSEPLSLCSGGEKTRLKFVHLLLTEPNLLLIDEPTNHLDQEGIDWLGQWLKRSEIPFVLVSHDRNLLNLCTTETWECSAGQLKIYPGNFKKAAEEKAVQRQMAEERYLLQKKKVSQLRRASQEQRVGALRMENFKLSRSVKKNGGLCKKDEGSGSGQSNPQKRMNAAKAMEKRIEKTIEKEEASKPWVEKQRKIFFHMDLAPAGKTILQVKNLGLKFGERSVFSQLNFSLEIGERLAIVGKNGSGKTSLLRILNGELTPSWGEFSWGPRCTLAAFSQDEEPSDQLAHDLMTLPSREQSEMARHFMGAIGLTIRSGVTETCKWSPGESAKLRLAQVAVSGANMLLLDEPTNHLEIPARELLEEALKSYQGGIVFVSHDREFVDRVATRVLRLPGV